MDISKITDLNVLKAMAYDMIAAKERAQNDLQVINQRISEVMSGVPKETAPSAEPISEPNENQGEE